MPHPASVPSPPIMAFILAKTTPVGYPRRMITTPLVSRPDPAGASARALTAAEFQGLAAVPPELEWFANLPNARTRRAYQQDVRDFTAFVGIVRPDEFRTVTRAHLIAWRKDLERAGARAVLHPPQARGAVLAVRLPLRTERGRRTIRWTG